MYPSFTSALLMVPLVARMLKPDQKVGIITVNSSTLSQRHFEGAGSNNIPVAIEGLETEEEFTHKILDDCLEMDIDKASPTSALLTRKPVTARHPAFGGH